MTDTEVRESSIEGRGVFALRDLRKGNAYSSGVSLGWDPSARPERAQASEAGSLNFSAEKYV